MKNSAWEITVPASTANLGPGFDSIGLALRLYLNLKIFPHHKWEVNALSHELTCFPDDESHFIVETAIKTAAKFQTELPPCRIDIQSDIPVASGLGSSGAAVLAGIELAHLCGDLQLSHQQKLKMAAEFEGHPDNVGASLFGGCVVSCIVDQAIEVIPLTLPFFEVVTITPLQELKTETARSLLPAMMPFEKAVQASSISNVMLVALMKGEFSIVGKLMENDLFHHPYRKPLLPHYESVNQIAKQNGAFGVAISGAGPTLACFVRKEDRERVKISLRKAFSNYKIQALEMDECGLTSSQITLPMNR
ncbi:homoserine kinase [Bacillus sp. 2205SS5-2]|uniref:homoserine kinase n=1 Tax=Bacillus sp. 2205SS5-2 TaxID=3109031 RepID=UPI003006E63D